jgi:uncharacterized coiled-coil protein SlyX
MSYHADPSALAIDLTEKSLHQSIYFINEDITELRSMISDLQHEVKLLTGKLSTFMSM